VSATLEEAEEQTLLLEDSDGREYRGRFIGTLICEEQGDGTLVYLTDDERVIVYEPGRSRYWEVQDPEHDLEFLNQTGYFDALSALGITPTVDI
jgi:hypothetical protein